MHSHSINSIEINKRYSNLAQENCCLSCGGAINYSKPQAGEVCIDLGSGRGQDVIKMAIEVGSEGKAFGIDISDGMIDKAMKNAHKLGVENVDFIQADLHSVPLPDETADLLISNCTINHAEDKDAVWSEIFRILKKGGRFVVSDIYAVEDVPEKYRHNPVAVSECWAGAVTRYIYMKTLKDAGFSDIQIIEESSPYKKGEVAVCSFTIMGWKPGESCCKK